MQGNPILYIGKAGGKRYKSTIRSRFINYLKFGQGKAVGHWGGRYIWQLKDAIELVVCWKTVQDEEPRDVEVRMMKEFEETYGLKPFANINK